MADYEHYVHPTGNKKPYVYFIFFLVIFLTIFTLATDITQNSPEFCAKCHTMKPEYYTWEASSHSSLGCTGCHLGEGVKGAYDLSLDLVRMTYAEITKSYITPIRLFRGIDDETCFRCHTFNRQFSVSGDLIIPHEQHSDRRVRCVSCHSAVAHGDIARRAITRKVSYTDWDKDQGLQEMARELVQPSMDDCMSCHYRRKVSTDCSVCHTDMTGPDHHQLADFSVNHGDFARAELVDCNFCHGYSGAKKMQVKENTTVTEYSRSNRFCLSCHRARPATHSGDRFKNTHGNSILTGRKDKGDCLVCHDNNLAEDIPKATEVTCSSCHPAKHGRNWRGGHLPRLMPGEGISGKCFMCHSVDTCLSCHYVPGFMEGPTGVPVLDDFNTLPEFPM